MVGFSRFRWCRQWKGDGGVDEWHPALPARRAPPAPSIPDGGGCARQVTPRVALLRSYGGRVGRRAYPARIMNVLNVRQPSKWARAAGFFGSEPVLTTSTLMDRTRYHYRRAHGPRIKTRQMPPGRGGRPGHAASSGRPGSSLAGRTSNTRYRGDSGANRDTHA